MGKLVDTKGRAGRLRNGDEAAAWVVRMASDQHTQADVDAFAAWLADDATNAENYAHHAELWQGMAALADNREARAILEHARPAFAIPRPRLSRRLFIGGSAAAIAAAAATAFVLLPTARGRADHYNTKLGEQRRLALADGSSVTLNTASRLRVFMTAKERRLFLDEGQAYFRVAKDASRPFRVFVGADEVRAIGTAFDVRRDGERAQVTLEEGVVALYRGTADQPVSLGRANLERAPIVQPIAILRPGQRAAIAPAAPIELVEVDVSEAHAWRYGRIVLDDAPLGEAVADVNRYGGKRIVLDDPALAALRISGVFHTSQPEAFVEGVTAALPVRLSAETETTLVLVPR